MLFDELAGRLRFGLAVGGSISNRSVFARKNYFYPDLPKGYQISQYESPIVRGGTTGYVYYMKEKPGGTVPLRKLTYARSFAPWQWGIATGIYIDDINISGTVGVDETSANYFNLNVYPNPSENGGDLTVDYYSHGKKVVINIVDMLGREVYTSTADNTPGAYQTTITGSQSGLKPGMYFVNVGDGTNMQTKKVIVH